MAVIFIGVMSGVLLATWLANAFFLEPFYIKKKQQTVIEAYETLNRGAQEGLFADEAFLEQLNGISFTDNISMLVIDTSGNVLLYTVRDFRILKNILYSYIFETDISAEEIKELVKTGQYIIRQRQDILTKAEYIEMLGTLDNGSPFVLQTAVESIRESVSVSNQFYAYIGIGAVAVSCLLIWFFSRRFTEPILELAELSRRMTELDFNAKFSGKQKNEFSFLGEHMNQMSRKLEQTISEL